MTNELPNRTASKGTRLSVSLSIRPRFNMEQEGNSFIHSYMAYVENISFVSPIPYHQTHLLLVVVMGHFPLVHVFIESKNWAYKKLESL